MFNERNNHSHFFALGHSINSMYRDSKLRLCDSLYRVDHETSTLSLS